MSAKKGGRPEIPVNPVTAERLKQLRLRYRETQEDVGRIIGYDKATVARYEKGMRGVANDRLATLARHWNVPVEFLLGETDAQSIQEFQSELDRAESSGAEFFHAAERAERVRLESFFERCGFKYENLCCTAYEFSGVEGNEQIDGPHRLTSFSAPDIIAGFSDDELQALIDRVRALVELECYMKSRRT